MKLVLASTLRSRPVSASICCVTTTKPLVDLNQAAVRHQRARLLVRSLLGSCPTRHNSDSACHSILRRIPVVLLAGHRPHVQCHHLDHVTCPQASRTLALYENIPPSEGPSFAERRCQYKVRCSEFCKLCILLSACPYRSAGTVEALIDRSAALLGYPDTHPLVSLR